MILTSTKERSIDKILHIDEATQQIPSP